MKKGSKVRVLADNRIGVVADQMFFTLGGKKTVRVLVKFEGEKEPVWIDRTLLTRDMTETVNVTFSTNDGDKVSFETVTNFENHMVTVSISGGDIMKLHDDKGLHVMMCMDYLTWLASPSKGNK